MADSYDKRFTQREYNALVDALDTALAVFHEQTSDEGAAQAALQDFVNMHYFKVWRAMANA